ncbi:Photosystem I reaction center subunit II, chloroplastic [Capsicum annuum]|uniref:Photosystem I reaction center subunit II, chloroplastic n=1 Tax=Capsicum annuum TaxID=4072 RepID=A0A2G2ZVH1_CAPAN|nr:Photosystem I reaction center subunit II, chloroplastic [Capsicum annuum]
MTHRPIKVMINENTQSDTKEAEPKASLGFTIGPKHPSPSFRGSTGGLLWSAQIEEFYVITWESPKEGPNLLKLTREEQN